MQIVILLQKYYIVLYGIEFQAGTSVEQDWSASWKDSHNNKLSYNREEIPKLGHNHRYVKCPVIHDWSIVYLSLM